MKSVTYLSLLGICLALYLLYEYFFPPPISPCYVNSVVNCEATTKGVLSTTVGLPTGLWGLIGYLVIFVSSLKKWPKLMWGMATFGMVFCLRITFLEILVLKVVCPVCLACQLVMLILFVITSKLNLKKHV